jgi:MFS family permease
MQQEPGTSHWWPTVGVMLGGLTVALNNGVLNVAIPSMMSSLSTDLDRIQWVQTGYQIIQAVLIPEVGWLGARLGMKRLFVLSTLVFIAGSALSGLAWDVHSLIFFRLLQGMGGGPIVPLSMSILYSTFPPDKRGFALGLSNFSHSFGPAIAPALGGYLIEVLSWRAIFYINVPVGLLSAGIVLFTMPKTQDQRARSFDAIGVFTMASFLILLLLAVSEGRHTPFQAGLFSLPPALVMGITSIIAGRLSDTVQPKLLLIIGLSVLTYVSFKFCGLDVWATTGVLLGLVVLRRGAQAFCHSPLSSSTLRGVPEDQVGMASGLFNLHRTLAGAMGVALTATLMDYREDVHTLVLSQRQALYPLGTEVATDAIRGTLMQDGESGGMLAQKTAGSLRHKLSEEAALTGYHDLFFMFAALTLFSLLPVLLMRGSKPDVPVKVMKKEAVMGSVG